MRGRSQAEDGVRMEIKEEFCAAIDGINSQETATSDIQPTILPNEYGVWTSEWSSQCSEVICPSIHDTRSLLRCRLCANQGDDMVDLLDPNKTDINILERIEHCLPIVVKETDSLPKQACRLCLANLELCYQFHKTVVKAERQLLAFSNQTAGKFDTAESNRQTLLLCDQQLGTRERDRIKGPLKTTSNSEMSDKRSATIPQEVRIVDSTTVKSSIVLASLKPCSVVLVSTKTHCAGDSNNRKRNSSDTNVLDSGKTSALQSDRQDTCDSEASGVTRTTQSKNNMISNLHREERFKNEKNLTIDKCTDTRKRRYGCNLCTKTFMSQGNLNRHNKFHTGKGLYSCEYCGRKFPSKADRHRHHLIHINKRLFKCSICERTFNVHAHLQRHACTALMVP